MFSFLVICNKELQAPGLVLYWEITSFTEPVEVSAQVPLDSVLFGIAPVVGDLHHQENQMEGRNETSSGPLEGWYIST